MRITSWFPEANVFKNTIYLIKRNQDKFSYKINTGIYIISMREYTLKINLSLLMIFYFVFFLS